MAEYKGKLMNGVCAAFQKRTYLTLELEDVIELSKLKGKPLRVAVDIWREKRSRNANAYFHLLSGKLADVRRVSKAKQKNELITSYGQPLYINDVPATVDTNLPRKTVENQEWPHMKFIRYYPKPDLTRYAIYRGSHTYDSREMAILIDGAISEAKDEGIETMTPDELAKLLAVWKPQEDAF